MNRLTVLRYDDGVMEAGEPRSDLGLRAPIDFDMGLESKKRLDCVDGKRKGFI